MPAVDVDGVTVADVDWPELRGGGREGGRGRRGRHLVRQ